MDSKGGLHCGALSSETQPILFHRRRKSAQPPAAVLSGLTTTIHVTSSPILQQTSCTSQVPRPPAKMPSFPQLTIFLKTRTHSYYLVLGPDFFQPLSMSFN